MSIQVTEQDAVTIREKIETGRYRDAAEVIHAALCLLNKRDDEFDWLKAELQIGIDELERGESVELTSELVEDIKRRARQETESNRRYKVAILP